MLVPELSRGIIFTPPPPARRDLPETPANEIPSQYPRISRHTHIASNGENTVFGNYIICEDEKNYTFPPPDSGGTKGVLTLARARMIFITWGGGVIRHPSISKLRILELGRKEPADCFRRVLAIGGAFYILVQNLTQFEGQNSNFREIGSFSTLL